MSPDNPPSDPDEQRADQQPSQGHHDAQGGSQQQNARGGSRQPTQGHQSAGGGSRSQPGSGGSAGASVPHDEIITTTPTIKPAIAKLVLALVIGGLAIVVLLTNPELFGSRETTDIVLLLVQVLLVISIIRQLFQILILKRTTYTVTSSSIKREYELFLQTEVKEVPFGLVRSHQFNQSRIENLLGHGTISINRGLGTLEMENVDSPDQIYEVVRERIENAA